MIDPMGSEHRDVAKQRIYPKIWMFCVCMLTWVVFSGLFDPFHLSLGVISSLIVTWAGTDILFPDDQSKPQSVAFSLGFVPYLAWLLYKIILANLHVFRLALAPDVKHRIEPSIIKFKTNLKSDFAKFILANSITLTPGTVTIRIEDNEFVVHAIDSVAAEGLQSEMELRVAKLFGEVP